MQHDAAGLHRVCTQTLPACVISACQAPNLMLPTRVAKVKRFPRNPRVRVATARCRDTTQALVQGQGRGTSRDAIHSVIALNRL